MSKNPAAVALGSITSPKKAAASRENGKKGGRPKEKRLPKLAIIERDTDGWWAILNPGWIIPHDNTHAVVEARKADALSTVRRAVPCNCEECQRLLAGQ